MAKRDATHEADEARKAAAYLSFQTFMSLLFASMREPGSNARRRFARRDHDTRGSFHFAKVMVE
jgi:hypothetical protein